MAIHFFLFLYLSTLSRRHSAAYHPLTKGGVWANVTLIVSLHPLKLLCHHLRLLITTATKSAIPVLVVVISKALNPHDV